MEEKFVSFLFSLFFSFLLLLLLTFPLTAVAYARASQKKRDSRYERDLDREPYAREMERDRYHPYASVRFPPSLFLLFFFFFFFFSSSFSIRDTQLFLPLRVIPSTLKVFLVMLPKEK